MKGMDNDRTWVECWQHDGTMMMKTKAIVNNFELELQLIAPWVFGGAAADNNIGKLGANIEMSFAWLRFINKCGECFGSSK